VRSHLGKLRRSLLAALAREPQSDQDTKCNQADQAGSEQRKPFDRTAHGRTSLTAWRRLPRQGLRLQRLLATDNRVDGCFRVRVLERACALAPGKFRIDEHEFWTDRL
jgi:hypothetical protein